MLPIVGAFVHEEWFAGGYGMDVDGMALEIVGKGLLDVENLVEDVWP